MTAFLGSVSHDYSREHLVLWCEQDGRTIALHADCTNPAALHNISVLLEEWPECLIVDSQSLAAQIDASSAAYAETQHVADGLEDETDDVEDAIARLVAATDADLLSTSGKSPVVRLIDSLLFEGIRRGASDIHFQPSAGGLLVRFRIDGALMDSRELPPRLSAPVASRIKVMGHMDIAETRMAQDGRASVTIGHRDPGSVHEVDLRISTLPTSDGERVVVRFLDSNHGQRLATLDAIGMSSEILSRYRASVSRPNGIVLLTGPTGSGKTTTLYATLREIATSGGAIGGGDLNIMTIEDPIEYKLNAPGLSISQSQVNRMKGMTFASGLRHILRQDPDVVMVG
ncbi:MAG: GspE/PulE family protein, partial [Phycisphaerales bacterium]